MTQLEPEPSSNYPSRDWRTLLFLSLVVLHIVPIWITPHLVTQDGPAHVENALAMKQLVFGSSPLLSEYLRFNLFPDPNWLGHGLLAALMLIVPPLLAEKLLVTVYVIALPLAVRFAIRAMRPVGQHADFLALLIFPFINGLALHKGLYNFCLGLPLWFIALGIWFRQPWQHRLLNASLLCGTLLLLFFTHVVPFGMAVLTISILAIGQWLRKRNITSTIDAMIVFNSMLPGVSLAMWFFIRHRNHTPAEHLPIQALVGQLFQLDALVSFTSVETNAARGLAVLIGFLMIGAFWVAIRRSRLQRPSLAIALLASIVFYLVAPNAGAGGGEVSFRLSLFPFFLAIVWLAAQTLPRRWIDFASIAAALISLVLVVDRTMSERRISPMLDEFASVAEHIAPNSTLWTEYLSNRDATVDGWKIARHVRPFIHANGLIAANRNIVDLTNYEAATDYFPLRFRDNIRPDKRLGSGDDDLLNFPRDTNGIGNVDYVLLWQTTKPSELSRNAAVRSQLSRGYEQVFVSSHGFATLYRAKASR